LQLHRSIRVSAPVFVSLAKFGLSLAKSTASNRDEKTKEHTFLLSLFVWQRQSRGAVPIGMGYLS
jgi:hypothetical protein